MDRGTSDLLSRSSSGGSAGGGTGSARGKNSDIVGALVGKCLSESNGRAISGSVTDI